MFRIVFCIVIYIALPAMMGFAGHQSDSDVPEAGASEAGQVKTTVEHVQTHSAEDVVSPCGPVPGTARSGHSVSELTSPHLSAAERALQTALDAAKSAAHGIRRWNTEEGAAGVTYAVSRYRIGAGGCVTELERMVNDTFSSNSDERVLYAEVHPMTGIDATKIDASFDAWVRGGAEEDRAVAYLAEQIEAFSVAHPDLQVFVVRGGWPNARNAGVTLVDTSSREAIWFFGRAVRMSAHRRSGSPVSP